MIGAAEKTNSLIPNMMKEMSGMMVKEMPNMMVKKMREQMMMMMMQIKVREQMNHRQPGCGTLMFKS